MRDQLLQLVRHVAAGEDARVDRRVECPDLAADEGRDGGQVADRRRLDAVRREVLARAVRGEDLDAQLLELTRESGDSLAVCDREQRTHLRGSSLRAVGPPRRFDDRAVGRFPGRFRAGAFRCRVYRGARGTP